MAKPLRLLAISLSLRFMVGWELGSYSFLAISNSKDVQSSLGIQFSHCNNLCTRLSMGPSG